MRLDVLGYICLSHRNSRFGVPPNVPASKLVSELEDISLKVDWAIAETQR